MTNYLLKLFSPEAAKLYRLLIKNKPLSAKELGEKLKIYPNAVYRNMQELVSLGLADKLYGYPIKYKVRPTSEAMDLCSSVLRENFQQTFGFKKIKKESRNGFSQFLIPTRQDCWRHTDEDIWKAKSAINFMVLGSELPQETFLAHKRAIERGVEVRMLVRNLNNKSREMFQNWEKIGIGVKHYPEMEARFFIFDHQIAYLASFNPNKIEESMSVRFDYPPYAKLMDELFHRRWEAAYEVT